MIFFSCLILLVNSYGIEQENGGENLQTVTELKKIDKGMPKQNLAKAGFTENLLLSYQPEGDALWVTYSYIFDFEEGNIITFYIKDDVIKDWFKGKVLGTLR